MKVLNNKELMKIEGGGINYKMAFGIIGGVIAFMIGFVDGIIHPKKCW